MQPSHSHTATPTAKRQRQSHHHLHHRVAARWRRGGTAIITRTLTAVVLLTLVAIHTTRGASSPWRRLRREEDPYSHTGRRLTVFGDDDRQAVSNPSSSPYSAVGLLKWSADRNCTAALIGSKYALTAADCVLNRDGTRRPSTLPQPELAFAGASTIAYVVKIHRQSAFWHEWTQETYAILELDQSVGETVGKLLLPTAEKLDQSGGKTPVQMVGFSGDVATVATPQLQFETCICSFPATFNGPQYMLHHNCDTSANGSPGSVLLVRYADMQTYILGIHTNTIGENVPALEMDTSLANTSYSDTVANRGVLAPFVQQHLQVILKNASMEESTEAGSYSQHFKDSGTEPLLVPVAPTTSGSAKPSTLNGGGGDESSVEMATTGSRISSTTAYACIGLVGLAWAGILFIAVRHVRRRK